MNSMFGINNKKSASKSKPKGLRKKSPKKIQETFVASKRLKLFENDENVSTNPVLIPDELLSTVEKTMDILPEIDNDSIVREGWLLKRGEHIKNWRARYFVLRANGNLQGFKGPKLITQQPLNNFTVRGCQIITVNKPKPFTFIMRGLSRKSAVERMFHTKTSKERDDWVNAIKEVALRVTQEETTSNGSSTVASPMESESASSSSSSSNSSRRSSNMSVVNEDISKLLKQLKNDKSCEDLTAKFNVQGVTQTSGKSKVTLENFEFLRVLGRGTFGKVILCREKETSEFYAVKVLKKDAIIRSNEVEHTLTESRVLRHCKHPFLVGLKCIFQTEYNICYVLEYANGGELFFHLSKARFFTEARTRFYAAEIIQALGYLHNYGIIYRDLKLENILLDKDGHIKIADFGLCKEDLTYGNTTRTFCGTPEYLAPEIIEDRDYGVAVDWWAVGVVVYEMMCGRLPFAGKDHQDLFVAILLAPVVFPRTLSDEAMDLVSGLLAKDPIHRLGGGPRDVREIEEHPYFATIDWNDLYERKIEPPFKPDVDSVVDTKYFDDVFTGESVALTPPEDFNIGDDLDDIVEEDDDIL